MGLGFGLLSAQVTPGETDWTGAYETTIDLTVEAERLGFTSIWTTEHHFVDDGYMPSPIVVSAAMAAATSRIEIGTGVVLAPLHHPLRLAEDAATAALVSGGRFTLGLGLGWSRPEFSAFGMDIHKRGAAMEEILQILPRAWSGEPFRHRGSVYDLPEVGVRPAPPTKLPILIGGNAEPAVRRAARLADGFFANAPIDRFLDQLEWIRDELETSGRDPSDFRVVHYSILLPGTDTDQAWDELLSHVWQMMWKYSDLEASAARSGPPPAPPSPPEGTRERLANRSIIAGSGEQLVERLQALREEAGVDVEFVARSFFPSLPRSRQLEIMQQLAEEVAPHV